jgi:hypothetical protein
MICGLRFSTETEIPKWLALSDLQPDFIETAQVISTM